MGTRKFFDIVTDNLKLFQSEEFAKDVTAMTINIKTDIIRCMRTVIVGKLKSPP